MHQCPVIWSTKYSLIFCAPASCWNILVHRSVNGLFSPCECHAYSWWKADHQRNPVLCRPLREPQTEANYMLNCILVQSWSSCPTPFHLKTSSPSKNNQFCELLRTTCSTMQIIEYQFLLQKYTPDLSQNCTSHVPKAFVWQKKMLCQEINFHYIFWVSFLNFLHFFLSWYSIFYCVRTYVSSGYSSLP